MTHGDLPCSNVQYHFWNKKRIESGSAIAFCKIHYFFLERNETTDTASKNHPNPVNIHIIFINTGIFHSLIAGH